MHACMFFCVVLVSHRMRVIRARTEWAAFQFASAAPLFVPNIYWGARSSGSGSSSRLIESSSSLSVHSARGVFFFCPRTGSPWLEQSRFQMCAAEWNSCCMRKRRSTENTNIYLHVVDACMRACKPFGSNEHTQTHTRAYVCVSLHLCRIASGSEWPTFADNKYDIQNCL